jgi:CRP/FNR family transcriptional regulator, cyclic AMP receptor protein
MAKQRRAYNPKTFLTTVGFGREMVSFTKGQTIYFLNDAADAIFVIQQGKVRLSVTPQAGKEAILDILSDGDFVGKDSVAGRPSRTASASAMTDCTLLRIEKQAMLRALTRHVKLANLFWAYVLARNIRYQQDLVDQHCSSSEKRLARVLLQLAHFDGHGAVETTVPKMKHETLAEMVGTTRSRISFFMNRFKESGFIFYENRGRLLRVHRTLLLSASNNFRSLGTSITIPRTVLSRPVRSSPSDQLPPPSLHGTNPAHCAPDLSPALKPAPVAPAPRVSSWPPIPPDSVLHQR